MDNYFKSGKIHINITEDNHLYVYIIDPGNTSIFGESESIWRIKITVNYNQTLKLL